MICPSSRLIHCKVTLFKNCKCHYKYKNIRTSEILIIVSDVDPMLMQRKLQIFQNVLSTVLSGRIWAVVGLFARNVQDTFKVINRHLWKEWETLQRHSQVSLRLKVCICYELSFWSPWRHALASNEEIPRVDRYVWNCVAFVLLMSLTYESHAQENARMFNKGLIIFQFSPRKVRGLG